jgi:hypothetical protein
MNIYLKKFLNQKIFNYVVVPVSITLFFAIVFMYAVIHEHRVNKDLLNQANAMEIQLTQLNNTNPSTDAFKTSLSHISDDLNSIKSEENLSAKSGDIAKISAQINIIKQNIDELKKLVVDNGNGKEFIDAKVLPFQVMSVDVISQQPFVSIEYDHHITPLGVGDTISGWQITDADYANSQVEFKNNKNQYVKVNLQG